MRPEYATIVYANILKDIYPDTPVVIGGIEASMRRFTHYDYWQDSLRKSILLDSKADLLVYGMGEQPITAIATALKEDIEQSGAEYITAERAKALARDIPQIGYVARPTEIAAGDNDHTLFSHEECLES